MKAKFDGEVVGIGESDFEGEKYPYFEILQRGESSRDKSDVFRVSGNGFTVGQKASFEASISLKENGEIRLKKLDAVPFKAAQKPL